MKTEIWQCQARIVGVLVFVIVAAAEPALAQHHDPSWILRFDLSIVEPSGAFNSVNVGGGTVESRFATAVGAGFRGEYQFSTRLGVDLGILGAGTVAVKTGILDGTIGSEVTVGSFAPFSLGLNVHLTPDKNMDLYVGPQLVLVSYSGVEVRAAPGGVGNTVSVDNDTGWGAIIGLDIPVGKHGWIIQTNLRYIDTDTNGSGSTISFSSEFNPVIFSLGFGYRF